MLIFRDYQSQDEILEIPHPLAIPQKNDKVTIEGKDRMVMYVNYEYDRLPLWKRPRIDSGLNEWEQTVVVDLGSPL